MTVKMITLPKQRVKSSFKDEVLDAYYPISVEENKNDLGLFPLYIDELLLMSRFGEDLGDKLNVGALKEDLDYLQKFDRRIDRLYSVSSVEALIGGLERRRSDAVVLRRSQLPREINLKKYKIQSLHFESMGLKVSKSFVRKSESSIDQLSHNFLSCLSSMDFKLPDDKKKKIFSEIAKDFLAMGSRINGPFKVYNDVSKREAVWTGEESFERRTLRTEVMSNKYTSLLRSFKEKYKYINEIFAFNAQGALVSSLNVTSDFDQSDESKFALVRDNNQFSPLHIQNIYFDRSEEVFQLGISIPLHDQAGRFIGGLFVACDINELLLHYRLNL
ncbi:hypothetical protein M900_1149 [Bacteriovorax sp. Seq25_V]|nr:hypothetical protein M900_1149 [Bacteriovorax sp. Seq25_V]